jgi:hypothetical protein
MFCILFDWNNGLLFGLWNVSYAFDSIIVLKLLNVDWFIDIIFVDFKFYPLLVVD